MRQMPPKVDFVCLFLLFTTAMLFGCATPTKLIEYPPLPESNTTIEFKLDSFSKRKFVAEKNINRITKDNVTVVVQDITEITEDERFSTTIVGPDDESYKVGITPMMLVLNVKNDTNHIITLRRTIIKIEDENLNDYPLISNISDAKNDLIKKVSKAFDIYLEDVDNFFKASIINHSGYKADYEKFVGDLRAASRRGNVKTQDVEEGRHLTPKGIENTIELRSPEYLYEQNILTYRKKVNKLKAEAINKIEDDIESSVGNIITIGEYPPISLIPGRTTEIIVPFNSRNKSEIIYDLYVNIFDMPTEVDQASNPTRREHFKFKLVAGR